MQAVLERDLCPKSPRRDICYEAHKVLVFAYRLLADSSNLEAFAHSAISIAQMPVPVPKSKIRGSRSKGPVNGIEWSWSCLATVKNL